jgi:predicted MFS family arabinose efflux permease
VLMLAGAAVAGAVLMLTLPRGSKPPGTARPVMSTAEVLRTLLRVGPLRRISLATMLTSLASGGLAVVAVRLADQLQLGASAGATMMAAFGVGNLVSALALTIRPLRGNPEKSTIRSVGGIALTLVACALANSLPFALVTFFLVGTMHAPYVAGSLGARADYAPPEARAQVFVTVAALKIVTGAAGAPLVGLLTGVDPRAVLVGCGVLVGLGVLATVIDRRLSAD